MSDTRSGLPSDSNYFPTVSDLTGTENIYLSLFLSQAKKGALEYLLHESLPQPSMSLKQNNNLFGNITENNNNLKRINQSILSQQKIVSNPSPAVLSERPNLVDAVTKSLQRRDYDKAAEETIVLYNLPEVNSTTATTSLDQILSTLNLTRNTIRQNNRMGPVMPDENGRSRPLEIVLPSAIDQRAVMSNAPLLKRTVVFVNRKFCWEERLTE